MAIFTAGSIPLTSDINRIREQVYARGRQDLDSSAIKVSLRKSEKEINYVAFLPKAKLYYENILAMAAKVQERSVVVFELEYKPVGVICEEGSIIDYILDKPEEYAKERGYGIVSADNRKGAKLVSLNLDRQRKETWMGTFLLLCTVLLTTLIFYVGYDHLKKTPILRSDKEQMLKEYHALLKARFDATSQITKKVDVLEVLENAEKITRDTHSQLRQVAFKDENLCVEIKTENINFLLSKLPAQATVQKENEPEGIVQYCYEKI